MKKILQLHSKLFIYLVKKKMIALKTKYTLNVVGGKATDVKTVGNNGYNSARKLQ